jgi:hypothetical protein
LNTHYGEKRNLNIAHNGCIVTMKMMKHSCKVTKEKGYSTAKGHEYATIEAEFGKIKRKSNETGWFILQCDRNKPLLEYSHVGIKGSLNDLGKNALIKEGKTHWIKKINLKKKNQVKKRQEIK